ncbi:MAG: hypothetical protein ISR25_02635 [Candidatus Poseidoniaceae archaeon]|nr:hypothetical protein [Candidatus Poseidoniaceae archaeon]
MSILSMLIIAPVTLKSSMAELPADSILEFNQEDGIHLMDFINVSGSSSVPLNSVEISLWNVTADGQYDLLNSSSSLLSVTPFETTLGTTNWLWNHQFNQEGESCTCLVRISLLEQTDLKSYGLTIYLGQSHHRPVLMFSSESYLTTQIMLTTEDVVLTYDVLLPPNLISLEEISNPEVLSSLSVCPAPFGICTDEYIPVTILHELIDGELTVTMESLSINLPDGLYLVDFYVQSMSLRESNTLTQYMAVDRNPPNVTFSSISELFEAEMITVDINVDDGYEGSVYSVTWTIIEPDGELRAVSSTEILGDNRLSFEADEQGVYQIFGLIRDLGGNILNVQHNVSVVNVEPQLDLRYDGYKISNNQTVMVKSSEEWCFSANQTTDTVNDIDSLQYNWFVDGKSLLSGRSYLLSSDIKSDDWKDITLTLTDDNGASTSITFSVEEQNSQDPNSFQSITIWTTILFLLIISTIVIIRKKVFSSQKSDFVRWSDTKSSDD